MASYDPSIIHSFADSLYSRARAVVVLYSLTGLFFGALVGGGLGFAVSKELLGFLMGSVVLGLIGGILAFAGASQKVFSMKLQAQSALCQVRIEANTQASLDALSAIQAHSSQAAQPQHQQLRAQRRPPAARS